MNSAAVVKLTFAGLNLHGLGDLAILDGTEYDPPPPALPTRLKRWLRVRVQSRPLAVADYEPHRAVLLNVLTHLKSHQAGALLWQSPDGLTTYLDRPVVVSGTNLPEDPNLVGTFEQAIEVTFAWEEALTATAALATSFTPTGGSAVTLGRVVGLNLAGTFTRPSEFRDLRSRVSGKASLTGKLDADPALDLTSRRAWLATQCAALETAFSAKAGTLVHGSFLNRLVRPTNYTAVVNQAEWCVDWTLDVEYNRFPDETDYLLVDYRVRQSVNREGGSVERTLSGTIKATNESAATAKLDALIAAQTALNFEELERETDPQTVETPDGVSYLETAFSVRLRQRPASSSLVRGSFTVNDGEELPGGVVNRRYSGSVTLRSTVSWSDAYVAAINFARSLGDNKHVFRLRRSLEIADNQQSFNRVVSGNWLVTVNYSFEYRVKVDSRFQWEVSIEAQKPRFGEQTLAVNGSITAFDRATADLHLTALKALLLPTGTTNFLREERVVERKEFAPRGTGMIGATPQNETLQVTNLGQGASATTSPGETYAAEVVGTLNGSPVGPQKTHTASATYGVYQQFLRLEFSFVIATPRPANTDLAVRYSLTIETDILRLTKRTMIEGEIFAGNLADVAAARTHLLAGFNTGAFGQLTKQRTGERREKYIGAAGVTAGYAPQGVALNVSTGEAYTGLLVGYTFSDEYEGRLTGIAGVIECRLQERVTHSGANVVVQPTAFGNDTFQLCGVRSARRTLSGTVTAATEATCRAWAHAALATPNWATASGASVSDPPEIGVNWDIEPRTELVARGVSANARLVQLEFSQQSYHEVLPYTAP